MSDEKPKLNSRRIRELIANNAPRAEIAKEVSEEIARYFDASRCGLDVRLEVLRIVMDETEDRIAERHPSWTDDNPDTRWSQSGRDFSKN